MPEISLTNLTRGRIPQRWLRKKAWSVLKELRLGQSARVSVVVVSVSQMRRWNRQYRGHDRLTDVLSFDFRTRQSPEIDGEIAICRAEVVRAAAEQGILLRTAFLRLVIHGILHLAGFQHEDVPLKKAKKMLRRQEQLMAKIDD